MERTLPRILLAITNGKRTRGSTDSRGRTPGASSRIDGSGDMTGNNEVIGERTVA